MSICPWLSQKSTNLINNFIMTIFLGMFLTPFSWGVQTEQELRDAILAGNDGTGSTTIDFWREYNINR